MEKDHWTVYLFGIDQQIALLGQAITTIRLVIKYWFGAIV